MSERFFFFLRYHANAFLFCKTVEHRSGEMSCRQERSRLVTRSHILGFVVTAFSVVASVLLHACSFVSHPSLRTSQGGILILLDVVSENIPS